MFFTVANIRDVLYQSFKANFFATDNPPWMKALDSLKKLDNAVGTEWWAPHYC